ncbi:hypothetical protein NE852_01100 (plasmid) [Rhizobium sp. Pop5]|uniref:hypothetical protein n=1 Tax=Rhizobium TaxID=379 RepID=UPI000283B38A|nr:MULTISPECIES: hypothetical protein [Rhizobium]KEC69612.1 hypothetical protein RLPCCGM1_p1804 [Rhizobium leguminosarum bv. phaseoli CCGM1]EJZ17179.1 hypothetical protein RCCGEPOP_32071 [Rhizobium sp. Pop5]MDK4728995.1 hypothetical protein [Rhizobium phaseoli]NKE90980.1 hypothetical protein [Rhizobium phaseoli]PDS69060.1 hypothetical protein CO651_25610 [Rhizobium phaseoli]
METSPNTELVSKSEVLALIFELFPWLRQFQQASLNDYAKAAFTVGSEPSGCVARSQAMSLLRSHVGAVAQRHGYSAEAVSSFQTEIEVAPVLQCGPHLHLLIEPDAFYTHLFSLMGLRAHGRTSYISYACSTVKFVERGRKGPAWLHVDGDAVNVFGLSRSKMIPYSILGRNGCYRFHLQNVDRPGDDSEAISSLRDLLPRGEFQSAAEAIKAANLCLWERYFGSQVDFLQLDDSDVADLVADHLSDGRSWLRGSLIEDRAFAMRLIHCIDQLADTVWRGWLKNSTHFFWGCTEGRLFPLWLDGRFLRSKAPEDVRVEFSPASLVEALRTGRIVPNLLLMFIVTSILPGVRVLGGSRHTIYYPLMRWAFCEALRSSHRDAQLLNALSNDERPGVWGHRIISWPCEPLLLLNAVGRGSIATLLEQFGKMSIIDACGSFSSFTQDPLWAELNAAYSSGRVDRHSSQWAFR